MCVFRERVSICVCDSLPLGFECGMWDVIVLVPYHCLSFNFVLMVLSVKIYGTRLAIFIFIKSLKCRVIYFILNDRPCKSCKILYLIVFLFLKKHCCYQSGCLLQLFGGFGKNIVYCCQKLI